MSRTFLVFVALVAFVVTFGAYNTDETPSRRSIRTILGAADVHIERPSSTNWFGSRTEVAYFDMTPKQWAKVLEFFQAELTRFEAPPRPIQFIVDEYQVPDSDVVKRCEIYVANEDSQSFLKTPSFSRAAFFWDKSNETMYFVFSYAYG